MKAAIRGGSGAVLALSMLVLSACASSAASRPVETLPRPDASAGGAKTADQPGVELEPLGLPDHEVASEGRDANEPLVLEEYEGEATFYADFFDGRQTASGAIFRQDELTAAHRELPFGTVVRVTNMRNDRTVTVRITDRGPFGERAKSRNRIIDLSRRAAESLGFVRAGWAPVKVEVLKWGEGKRR